MLYLIYGGDRRKNREYLSALRAKLSSQYGTPLEITPDVFSPGVLEERAAARGLFSAVSATILLDIGEDTAARTVLSEKAKILAMSPNVFIVFEGSVPAPYIKKLSVYARKSWKTEALRAADTSKEDSARLFQASDAVFRKDKKSAWVLFQQALRAGAAPEQIAGTFFWQAKMIYTVKRSEESADREYLSGIKPFVLNKTRALARQYSVHSARREMENLLDMYHQAHQGGMPLSLALERFILRRHI